MNMTPTLKESRSSVESVCEELKKVADGMNSVSQIKNKESILACIDRLHEVCDKIDQSVAFMYFGQKSGGQRSTAKKTKAVQENGKKGGRPSKKILINVSADDSGSFYAEFDDGSRKKAGSSMAEVRETFPPSRYRWSDSAENLYEKLTQG